MCNSYIKYNKILCKNKIPKLCLKDYVSFFVKKKHVDMTCGAQLSENQSGPKIINIF